MIQLNEKRQEKLKQSKNKNMKNSMNMNQSERESERAIVCASEINSSLRCERNTIRMSE
jgi:hypothetical protein